MSILFIGQWLSLLSYVWKNNCCSFCFCTTGNLIHLFVYFIYLFFTVNFDSVSAGFVYYLCKHFTEYMYIKKLLKESHVWKLIPFTCTFDINFHLHIFTFAVNERTQEWEKFYTNIDCSWGEWWKIIAPEVNRVS